MSDAPELPADPSPVDPSHAVVEGGAPVHLADRPVLVVDFGAQYAQLIARRVREARVYSEIVPHTMPVDEMLARRPRRRSCCPAARRRSTPRAPRASTRRSSQAGVPVFGMCYGFQAMALALGGEVRRTGALGVRPHPPVIVDAAAARCSPGMPAEHSRCG